MTQEEKQLLTKDICARLPYDVCVHIRYKTGEPCYGKLTPRDIQWFIDSKIENIKPYLRPLSSMTEEEKSDLEAYSKQELDKYADNVLSNANKDAIRYSYIALIYKDIDWYNKNHFDYRGLIPMGLGIDCTGLHIYENEKSI